MAGDEDGKAYLEQHGLVEERHAKLLYPLFVTGDPEWGDYMVEADVRPLSFAAMAGWCFGITRAGTTICRSGRQDEGEAGGAVWGRPRCSCAAMTSP